MISKNLCKKFHECFIEIYGHSITKIEIDENEYNPQIVGTISCNKCGVIWRISTEKTNYEGIIHRFFNLKNAKTDISFSDCEHKSGKWIKDEDFIRNYIQIYCKGARE